MKLAGLIHQVKASFSEICRGLIHALSVRPVVRLCDPFRVVIILMLDPGVARETRFTPGYYL